MRKMLKEIAQWCNRLVAGIPIVLVLIPLFISSLVMIILSPLIAFVGTNEYKLIEHEYNQGRTISTSWWKIYKNGLIVTCTELLPIVVYKNNL